MRHSRLSLAVLLAVAALTIGAAPADKGGSTQKKPVSAKEELRKFDPSVTKLPVNFVGSSIQAAFRRFSVSAKGEFETSAEYEARQRRVPWGIYAFAIPLRFTSVSYDADAEIMAVSPRPFWPDIEFSPSPTAGIELARELERSRKYPASNAFGATIVVDEYSYHSYSVITQMDEISPLHHSVDRTKAAKIKEDVRVLAIVALDDNSPITHSVDVLKGATGFRHAEPTFDDPSEVAATDHSIRAQLLELWLFRRSTGEILGRYNADGTPIVSD